MSVIISAGGEYRFIGKARAVRCRYAHYLTRPIEVGRFSLFAIEIIYNDYRIASFKHGADDIYVGLRADSLNVRVYEIESNVCSVISGLCRAERRIIVIGGKLYGDTDVSVVFKSYLFADLLIGECCCDLVHSVVLVLCERHYGEYRRQRKDTSHEYDQGDLLRAF